MKKKPIRHTQRKVRNAKGRATYLQKWLAEQFTRLFDSRFVSNVMGEPGSDVKDIDKAIPWWDYTEAKNWNKWPSLNHLTKLLDDTKKGTQVQFLMGPGAPGKQKKKIVIMEYDTFESVVTDAYKYHTYRLEGKCE